jgi:nucleoside-diphosphate-sugar epimerase
MPAVFITGASGFLGAALARRYAADGWQVRGVDRTADPARGIVAGDVAQPGPWQDRVRGCELVVHAAAVVSMRVTGRAEVERVNVGGTLRVLEAAERAGARRLVHLSTVVVFGPGFPDGVDERAPVRVTGLPYGDSKVAAEQGLLQAHAEGRLPVTIVRPADVYGPGSRAWAVIPYELIARRRFVLPAGGRGLFSPVYVDDLVDGVVRAGATAAAAGQVITLSGGVGVPNRDFFAPYAALAGRRLLTAPAPVALAVARARRHLPGDPDVNAHAVAYLMRRGTYGIAKARAVLGWAPATPVDEGLARTVAWLRARHDGGPGSAPPRAGRRLG